jgi:hypothetical protein
LEILMASRSIVSRSVFAATFAAATLLTSFAFADAIAPDEGACSGKTAGAACKIDVKNGTCVNATCTRLDYANWDRDATAGPPSKQEPCVLCNTDAGVEVDPVDAAPADAAHALGAEPPTTPASTSSSSCSVPAAVGLKAAGPLALAAVVPFGLLLLGRRRRRP